jgi:hypothetical protein
MPAANTAQPYFAADPQFDTWLGKPLSEDGVYEGNEGSLAEWYNGVHWNTRIRIRSGGPQITDDILVEGCDKDRATARQEAEKLMLNRLKGLTSNASEIGLWTIRI